ncbi:MAG: hypothetical protein GX369_08240, partial [Euryarchaeota archaeon]|nr:hypothetical protein [Euryarchaeota archaeon]
FGKVEIKADDVVLTTQGKTTIDEIKVHEDLSGITIKTEKGTTVKELVLESVVEVDNAKGTVEKISGDKADESELAYEVEEKAPVSGGGGGDYDSGPSKTKVSAISVVGVPVVGETLSVETTPGGAAATGAYQWLISDKADGSYAEIEGATEDTYTPVAGDKGKYIKVKVTGKGNYRGTVTSDPVQVVTAYISTATPKAEVVGTVGWTRFAGTVKVGDNAEGVKAYYIFEITEGTLVEGSVPQFFNYTNDNKGDWLPFGVEEIGENDHAKYRFGPPNGFALDDGKLPVKGQTEFQVNIEENITGKAYLVNTEEEIISNIVETTIAANPMPHAILSQVEEINQQVPGEEGYTRFAGTVQVADGAEGVNAYYVFEIIKGSLAEESVPQYWDYEAEKWKNFAKVEDKEGVYRFGSHGGFPLSQELPYNGQTEFQAEFDGNITVKAYLVKAGQENEEVISNVLTLTLKADTELTEQLRALAAISADLEVEISGVADTKYGKVKKVVEDNAKVLGLAIGAESAYGKLDDNRKLAAIKDLYANKPEGGYSVEGLVETFDSIVIVRTATQESFALANGDLEDLEYIQVLLTAYEKATHEKHGRHDDFKLIETLKTDVQNLADRYEALSEDAKEAVITKIKELKGEGFTRSRSTLEALKTALDEYGIAPAFSVALGGNAVVVTAEDNKVDVGELNLPNGFDSLVKTLLSEVSGDNGNGKTLYATGVTLKVDTESERNVRVVVSEPPTGVTYYMYDTEKSQFIDTQVWGPSTGFPVNDEAYKTGVTTPVFFTLENDAEELAFTIKLVGVGDDSIVYGKETLIVTIPAVEGEGEGD